MKTPAAQFYSGQYQSLLQTMNNINENKKNIYSSLHLWD